MIPSKFKGPLVRPTKASIRREVKHRVWPELKEGEFVYYVKRLTGKRELKFVTAFHRAEAEFKAFPEALSSELRSMPVHTHGEMKGEKDV